jgi:hypothetical protein
MKVQIRIGAISQGNHDFSAQIERVEEVKKTLS